MARVQREKPPGRGKKKRAAKNAPKPRRKARPRRDVAAASKRKGSPRPPARRAAGFRESQAHRWESFLHRLPHDFANAFLPCHLAADLLKHAAGDKAVLDQVLRILDEQSHKARLLVEDLDRALQVVRGEIEIRRRRVNLENVVERGIAAGEPDTTRALELRLVRPDAPIEVEADAVQLAAAIQELVDNAARFSGGTTVHVVVERVGRAALVRVRDEGLGIEDQFLETLFEPFAAAAREESGWGIGLPFVRAVMAAHEGSIDVRGGSGGKGLEVVLRLPLASAS